MSMNIPSTNKDHLVFYMENDISPVRQNIDDIQKHLERRSSLYQKIGLLMSDIDDCWINLFEEVVSLMKGKIITENDISKMKFFKKLFGRELIYVSAIKSNAPTL